MDSHSPCVMHQHKIAHKGYLLFTKKRLHTNWLASFEKSWISQTIHTKEFNEDNSENVGPLVDAITVRPWLQKNSGAKERLRRARA